MSVSLNFIKSVSDLDYPETLLKYGVSKTAKKKVLKRFRKNDITISDIIELLDKEEENSNRHSFLYFGRSELISFIAYIFENFFSEISEDQLIKLSENFQTNKEFVNFIDCISKHKDIFSGTDIEISGKITIGKLLECRSYKIHKLING